MTHNLVVDLIRDVLMQTMWLSLPLLALGFIAGIAISVLQILTSVQDPAFGAVPRLLAFFVGLLLFLPWMLVRLTSYTSGLLGDFSRYVR